MPYMWADTLQVAEHAHLLRLLAWSAASVLAGTALLAWMRAAERASPLLKHFAIQAVAWGAVNAMLVAGLISSVGPRDVASATRLDRILWMSIGLDSGFVLVGVTLVAVGWQMGRRSGLVGAGMGVIVQGGALALLDLILAARISR